MIVPLCSSSGDGHRYSPTPWRAAGNSCPNSGLSSAVMRRSRFEEHRHGLPATNGRPCSFQQSTRTANRQFATVTLVKRLPILLHPPRAQPTRERGGADIFAPQPLPLRRAPLEALRPLRCRPHRGRRSGHVRRAFGMAMTPASTSATHTLLTTAGFYHASANHAKATTASTKARNTCCPIVIGEPAGRLESGSRGQPAG